MSSSPDAAPTTFRLRDLLVQIVVVSLITTALLEVLVALSFRYPKWSPMPIDLVRYLHIRFDRNVIQVMPECAIYDEALTYILRPGRCTFASREFANEYRINSLGLRDDEESLAKPDVVVLGDSLTMGWGVNQGETYVAVFEALTRRKTLNAGISSYGTVRELRLLERIDRSALRDVVIQYMNNDVGENAQLIEHPPFVTLSRSDYERTVQDQARLLRYFPGKYAFNVMVQLQSALRQQFGHSRAVGQVTAERQAELFVQAVERSPVDLSPFRVSVLSFDRNFIDSARRVAKASPVKWVARARFVDASSTVSDPGRSYILDDHPTARGHAAIAELLARELGDNR
jgi:lysophospholipase L1-like esterase